MTYIAIVADATYLVGVEIESTYEGAALKGINLLEFNWNKGDLIVVELEDLLKALAEKGIMLVSDK